MNITTLLYQLLGPLVEGAMYWDETPDGGPERKPFLVVSIIGGKAQWLLDQSIPDYQNARVQVNAFAESSTQAEELIKLVARTLAGSGFPVEPVGNFSSSFGSTTKLRGYFQQFGIWWPDPVS